MTCQNNAVGQCGLAALGKYQENIRYHSEQLRQRGQSTQRDDFRQLSEPQFIDMQNKKTYHYN